MIGRTLYNQPLVSICIPTYNDARFLRESLDSIVNQTYSNKEIIVSDNVSTDETEKIVKEYVGIQILTNGFFWLDNII